MLEKLLRRWRGPRAGRRDILDRPLLHWSPQDPWTVRDATQGTLILGATGSGKTSGSGQALAKAMLAQGFGGLVLTAKADETELWRKYCAETGRSDDLVVFGSDGRHSFNFLDFERTRGGAGAGLTENVVSLFSTVLEIAERGSAGGSGREDEGYWRRATRQLLRNAVDLALLAGARLSVPELYRLVTSAPQSLEQVRSEDWRQRSLLFKRLGEADRRTKNSREADDFEIVADFWLSEFPNLSEKTRSVVVSSFTSLSDVLNRGLLRDLLCGETTVTPKAVEDGKVIVIDLAVKEFAEVGQYAQVIWKYLFQRSVERRQVSEATRPAFLWADEAQHFVTSYDMQFQTTCRSAQVATVLLSQNVSNFYAALGGSEKGRAEAASLFANLNTKILHANGDPVTNEWASSLVGRSLQQFANGSSGNSPEEPWGSMPWMSWSRENRISNAGFSEAYEFEVQPAAFTQLATGGPENRWTVGGIVFQNGRLFRSTGKTWAHVNFKQR